MGMGKVRVLNLPEKLVCARGATNPQQTRGHPSPQGTSLHRGRRTIGSSKAHGVHHGHHEHHDGFRP